MNGIVVGAEPSADGREAVRWALQEARDRKTPLFVLRAYTDEPYIGFGAEPVLTADPDERRRRAYASAEEVIDHARTQVPSAGKVDIRICPVPDAAGPALARAALGRSLLVVGSRHAGPVTRALFGSVTEYVLHHAQAPVAVVPAPARRGDRPPRVIVGVDHSPASVAALAWAADEAARRHLTLMLVLCRDEMRSARLNSGDMPVSLEELEGIETAALVRAVPDKGVVIEPQLVTGRPAKALLHLAEPQDLLVVGSRGRTAVAAAVLGSTSRFLAEHAHCPVIVVQEGQVG